MWTWMLWTNLLCVERRTEAQRKQRAHTALIAQGRTGNCTIYYINFGEGNGQTHPLLLWQGTPES